MSLLPKTPLQPPAVPLELVCVLWTALDCMVRGLEGFPKSDLLTRHGGGGRQELPPPLCDCVCVAEILVALRKVTRIISFA